MILVQTIKFNNNNYLPSRQRKILSPIKSDSFQRVESKPAFRGIEKEINLHFPVKEFEKLFAKAYREIIKESDIDKKIKLTGIFKDHFGKIVDSTAHGKFEELGASRFNFINDREHEVYGPLLDLYGHIYYIQAKKMKNILVDMPSEKYNELFKRMSVSTIKSIKRYELLLNNGLDKDIMSPKDVFKLALDSVKEKLNKKNVKVKIQGEKFIEINKKGIYCPMRRIHDYELYSVFSNLIQNSAKYTKENSTILINFKKKNIESKKYLEFVVTDRGIGIPPEEQGKVLEGERASNAIASRIGGTGYGLRRVRKILEFLNCSYLEIKSPLYPKYKDFPGTKISCFIDVKE